MLLEDNAVQAAPRPGTSLSRPHMPTGATAGLRPLTQSGRPTTGFARPGTSSRPMTGSTRLGTGQRTGTAKQRVATALRGGKPGTARPTTTSGRFVRLGTASLASQPGGPFIDVARLDLAKYAPRKHLSRALCDYVMYGDRNDKAASVLCQAALVRRRRLTAPSRTLPPHAATWPRLPQPPPAACRRTRVARTGGGYCARPCATTAWACFKRRSAGTSAAWSWRVSTRPRCTSPSATCASTSLSSPPSCSATWPRRLRARCSQLCCILLHGWSSRCAALFEHS